MVTEQLSLSFPQEPGPDWKQEMWKEHRRAELQRLDEGLPGCGCPVCQELYRELDLSRYGGRVSRQEDIVSIAERRSKDDLDHWSADGATFVHYCKGYRVTKAGRTVCIGKVGAAGESLPAATTGKGSVTTAKISVAKGAPDVPIARQNATDNSLTCWVCGKSFTAKRRDARFCSSTCRSAEHRGGQGG